QHVFQMDVPGIEPHLTGMGPGLFHIVDHLLRYGNALNQTVIEGGSLFVAQYQIKVSLSVTDGKIGRPSQPPVGGILIFPGLTAPLGIHLERQPGKVGMVDHHPIGTRPHHRQGRRNEPNVDRLIVRIRLYADFCQQRFDGPPRHPVRFRACPSTCVPFRFGTTVFCRFLQQDALSPSEKRCRNTETELLSPWLLNTLSSPPSTKKLSLRSILFQWPKAPSTTNVYVIDTSVAAVFSY